MAKSITKAQAEALADDFDFGGDDRNAFAPANSITVLYKKAGELVEQAQDNLNKADHVASGAGSASIKVLNPEKDGKRVRIDISMLFYLQFIDQGVRGVKSGSGKYAFKTKYPGKKMMEAIRKWLIKEGLKARTVRGERLKPKTAKLISQRETKRKSITETSNSVAYAIASSIKQKGIKPSRFMERAIRDTRRDVRQDLGAALKLDVIAAIPKKLENT